MRDVLSLGIFCVDLLIKPVNELPRLEGMISLDAIELSTGGCASNTAVILARLGAQVSVLGRIRQDMFGDLVLHTLTNEGINTEAMVRDETVRTALTVVAIASEGERRFLYYEGANRNLVLDDVNMDFVRWHRILHVGSPYLLPGLDGAPLAQLLAEAQAAGVTTSVDTVTDDRGNPLELIAPALPYIDHFLPSLPEARMISGLADPPEIADFFLDRGVKVVGLKAGDQGAYIATADRERWHIPAFPVTVVDATGAGDAWVGGFLTGVLHGWSLPQTTRFANAVGASCVAVMGATEGITNMAAIWKSFQLSAVSSQTNQPAAES